jgi:flagellar biosynthetic protein FliP
MTIEIKTKLDHMHTTSVQTFDHLILNIALKVGFFIWHYLEMMLAMMVGSTLFELLVRGMPKSASYAMGLRPGTFLYISGIALSMMFVMVAWMIVRGHGWRHSAEMSVAMLVPVALVALISILKGGASLAWFDDTYCSAMCVGMLGAMLYRWDHFTRWSFRSSHHGH